MSGNEDFGPLMDVLVTCVGAVDVISVLALICNQSSSSGNDSPTDINNNNVKAFQGGKIRDKSPFVDIQKSARNNPAVVIDKVNKTTDDDDVINSLRSKVNELEVKVEELEERSRENSMERFLEEERERVLNKDRLRRSLSPTPDHYSSFLEQENESNESDESHGDASQQPITRDDGESDRAIKRSSQVSQREDSREEETNDTDDCAPLAYQSDTDGEHHLIESISTCPEEKEIETSTTAAVDVNENFIKMERMQTQQSAPKMLMKQANVSSEDFPEEIVSKLQTDNSQIKETEVKETVESIMAHANVSSQPKIENFPKSNEITASVDETVSELISTHEQFESPNVMNIEDLANARTEPPVMVQSYAKVLSSDEFNDETVGELPPPPPIVEIISDEPQSVIGSLMDVNINPSINLQTKGSTSISANSSSMNLNVSTPSLQSGNASLASSALENDYAVRRMTPEPDVSIDARESSIEKELLSVGSSGDRLRRTKRCIDSLDRSGSRSSSRLSRSRKSKSPSVASEEDYKEWFDKFDNHLSAELTLPENDDDIFDSDAEEELLMDADAGNLDGAEICNIDEDRDVSVSITLNLKQKQASKQQQQSQEACHPCKDFQEPKVFKTKAEELDEMKRNWEEKKGGRRLSILPSTEEQQQSYVSILHPEEFPAKSSGNEVQREHHQHHEHLHNVGYSEWMKKIVDHHSCHLALSDSGSDSDVPLDEVQMLPLFCDEAKRKKKQNRRRKK